MMSTEEIFILLAGGTLIISSSFMSMRLFFERRSRLLALFSLSWLSMALYLLFSAMSSLFQLPLLYKINDSIIVTSGLIFFLMFLDYAQHDDISAKKTAISIAMFAVIFTWNWYPTNVVYLDAENNIVMPFIELYYFIQNVYIATLSFSIAYWQVITARSSPKSFRQVKRLLYIGAVFASCAGVTVFLTSIPEASAMMFISIIGMAFTSTIAIQKEPRIVHLLPYTVYRLVVASKWGPTYYSYEWAPVDVESDMISGMVSAINTFSLNVLKDVKSGMISEIKLQKSTMLTDMKYTPVNFLILSSKASTNLKDSLNKFSAMFMDAFKDRLYDQKNGTALQIPDANRHSVFTDDAILPIVGKCFSNIPNFM